VKYFHCFIAVIVNIRLYKNLLAQKAWMMHQNSIRREYRAWKSRTSTPPTRIGSNNKWIDWQNV